MDDKEGCRKAKWLAHMPPTQHTMGNWWGISRFAKLFGLSVNVCFIELGILLKCTFGEQMSALN